jgi:hypothetical protein
MALWLRRLEGSAYREQFVLRGGLLLDAWIANRRPVRDIDFLALMPLDEADAAVKSIASVGCSRCAPFEVVNREVIWAETPWPGLRYRLGPTPLQLDVGVGDPMVQLPRRQQVLGTSVLCCTPEVLYGWKVHGLFERGEGRWRAKDLWDLYLMQSCIDMNDALLIPALSIAFSSRQTALDVTRRFFREEWGQSPGSRKKWSRFCADVGPQADVVRDLQLVKCSVAARLGSLLNTMASEHVG